MPEQAPLYNPDETAERSIPNTNEEGSFYTIGRRASGGMLSAARTQQSAWQQPQQPATQTFSTSGGLGNGGLGPSPRPVEPAPGPGIVLPGDSSSPAPAPAPDPGTAPPSYPWDGGQNPPVTQPGQQDPLSHPGAVQDTHYDIPAPDPNDPDNWAFGLEERDRGLFYDARTNMYYDRFGRKITPSHTGPVGSTVSNPGDGPVYSSPGAPGSSGPGWGVNPLEWFSQNLTPMQLHQSDASLEGMLLGPHDAQQSENVNVGPMSQSFATTAPYTDLSGLTGPNAVNIDSGPDAQASGYDATTQEVDPTQTASGQMAEILSRDSPLMQRARQEGILMAARRGLTNSSIAAGTATGAMVDRATPLALSNAQQYAQQALSNQAALNTASQFNSQWENQMEQLNKSIRSQESTAESQLELEGEVAAAQIRSAESQFNAELQTQNAQFNANWSNQAQMLQSELRQQNNQFNAGQQNAIDMHIMQMNTALNEQYLRGSQALDLATIQGQFSALISQNQMAGELFSNMMNSIGNVMANHEIAPGTIASYVEIQQNLLQSALQLLADMNNIQFGDDLFEPDTPPPGTPGTGGGGTGFGGEIGPVVSH